MAVVFPEYVQESASQPSQPSRPPRVRPQVDQPSADIGQRFEQMLWSEMLSHAGLEKAFTQSGGEGAAAFSRYIVEAIAKDIALTHPLGLGPSSLPKAPGGQ